MRAWQQEVAEFVSQYELAAPVEARLLDLLSELGEVAKEALRGNDYGRRTFEPTEEWSAELGDALFSLLCLANSTGVELAAALESTLEKYRQRLSISDTPSSMAETN